MGSCVLVALLRLAEPGGRDPAAAQDPGAVVDDRRLAGRDASGRPRRRSPGGKGDSVIATVPGWRERLGPGSTFFLSIALDLPSFLKMSVILAQFLVAALDLVRLSRRAAQKCLECIKLPIFSVHTQLRFLLQTFPQLRDKTRK